MQRDLTIEEAEALRACFRSEAATADGRILIGWWLRKCGMWEQDAARIVPEKIAMAHEFLAAMGVGHGQARTDEIVAGLAVLSNDDDLLELRKQGGEDAAGS